MTALEKEVVTYNEYHPLLKNGACLVWTCI